VKLSARSLALQAIRRVTDQGAYSNLLIPSLLGRSKLDPRDRALATELAYGTLRRLLPLDQELSAIVDRPLATAAPDARAALRLGAYQLRHTRIPAHAAVSETVELLPANRRGFVNAILRRLAARSPAAFDGDGDGAVSLRTGLAPWAVAELRRLLPEEEVEPAAAALASPGPLTLRTNRCRATAEELASSLRHHGLDPEPGRLQPECLRVAGGNPTELPGYREGWFAVQDEASAFVVQVLDPQQGERVLDACAAPGGKASDIACRAGRVVAGDVSVRRVALVARTAARLGVLAPGLAQDAGRPALREGFDRVLVDAPCSGIGAARRRPELLWRPRRLSGLARLQVRVAAGAAALLRPGGVLVYSVCTFPRAETDAVCRALLAKAAFLRPDMILDPDGRSAPSVRLWPHRHGTDAMFVARFVRKA
jgi:16S rRNA (cytosine967-C5)-methyltransferase